MLLASIFFTSLSALAFAMLWLRQRRRSARAEQRMKLLADTARRLQPALYDIKMQLNGLHDSGAEAIRSRETLTTAAQEIDNALGSIAWMLDSQAAAAQPPAPSVQRIQHETAAKEASAAKQEKQAKQSNDEKTGRTLVLVVEDNDDMRNFLVQSLQADFNVIEAKDGGQGLDIAKERIPDVVVSDVMMPVMQGDELCRRLRSNIETSHIVVILVSALSEREDIIYGLEAGADDYMAKPFDVSILRTRIRNLLERRLCHSENALAISLSNKAEYKSKLDKVFMDKAMDIIERKMSNSDFTINELCQDLGMSRSSVFGKLKALTGKGPNDIIKAMRLNKAKELLLTHEYNVSEVADKVGFTEPKYFSVCFKKQFGVSPSEI